MKPLFKLMAFALALPMVASCGTPNQSSKEESKTQEPTSLASQDDSKAASSSTTSQASSSTPASSSKPAASSSTAPASSSSKPAASSSAPASSSKPAASSSTAPASSSSQASSSREPVVYEPPAADSAIAQAYQFTSKTPASLPRIDITTTTNGGTNNWATDYNRNYKLSHEITYETATVSVSNGEENTALTDVAAGVKVRGNYTLDYVQKGIRIKFDKKQSMLGLNGNEKYKSWVLLADYKDNTNTQNFVTDFMGNNMLRADGLYCTDSRHVNVYLNNQYWGVYLLAEQQQEGSTRMNVPKVESTDVGTDIGYICELDYYYDQEDLALGGDYTFTMDYEGNSLTNFDGDTVGNFIRGYTIKSDTNNDTQRTFIKNYVQNCYKLMYSATHGNTFYKFNDDHSALVLAGANEFASAKECVESAVNVQSLVDMYLLQDIACDPDVGYSSFYLDVDMSATGSKKLTFEAPWDYDSAYGVTNRMEDPESGTFAANHKGQNRQPYYPNAWFTVLIHEDWFMNMIQQKWQEMKHFNLFQRSLDLINTVATNYETDFANLKAKWPQKWQNMSEKCNRANARTTQKQAAQDLMNWLSARFLYLDGVYGNGDLQLNPAVIYPNLPVISNGTSGGNTGGGGMGGGGQQQVQYNDNDNTVKTATKKRYEAENMTSSGTVTMDKDGTRYSTSGNKYVGSFGAGATLTFNVTASEAANAYVYLGMARHTYTHISNVFSISVNGVDITPSADKYVPSYISDDYHEFFEMPVGMTNLNSGSNTVVITAQQNNCANFDYVDIQSPATLS